MKNSINFFLATLMLIALLNPMAAIADPVEDIHKMIVKVAPSEEGRAFELRMANLEKQLTKVKILDVTGYTLLSEMVTKEDGYSKLIKLDNLPIGDYLLHIEHPNGAFNHAFHLGGEAVSFFNTINNESGFTQLVGGKKDAANFPGRFEATGKDLNVQMNGLSGNTVKVHICNLKGKTYLRKKIKGVADLNENFNTEKLPFGEFLMVVRAGNKTVIQPFEKTNDRIELRNTLVSKPIVIGEMEIYSQR
ncbi:MAG: hypothetical protein AAFZ15_14210 [Bacteroidota bacterium]